jgi:LysM repeat protein
MEAAMTAMRALALPEADAESQATATRTVPAQVGPGTATGVGRAARAQTGHAGMARTRMSHDLAARVTTARATPARTTPARRQAVAAHGQAAAARLRLTRRGRIVVAAAAALLVSLLSLLATGSAQATSHSIAPDHTLTQVVVQPGQSLWSVAENADPNADPRQVMQQIIELNGLAGDVIMVGQRLWVPRG